MCGGRQAGHNICCYRILPAKISYSEFCFHSRSFSSLIISRRRSTSSSLGWSPGSTSSSSHPNFTRSRSVRIPAFLMSAIEHITKKALRRAASHIPRARARYPLIIARISQNCNTYRNSLRSYPISPTNNSYNSWALVSFFLASLSPAFSPVPGLRREYPATRSSRRSRHGSVPQSPVRWPRSSGGPT